MKMLRVLTAAMFALALLAPAQALALPTATQTLASAVVATTNQAFTSVAIGDPKVETLCMSASAATTFTVTESIDGALFYAATIASTTTAANYAPAGAGTLCETIAPAPYVRVATSAAVTVTIQLSAAL